LTGLTARQQQTWASGDYGAIAALIHPIAEELVQHLPYPDAAFDAVLSVVGAMFAPDQERTAAELLRVCGPGGTVAMADWTPDGFVGEMFRTVGRRVPPPGIRSPVVFGSEARLRELFPGAGLRVVARTFVFRFESPAVKPAPEVGSPTAARPARRDG
jgi:SAM-dependent methyltransferase